MKTGCIFAVDRSKEIMRNLIADNAVFATMILYESGQLNKESVIKNLK
jgi:hypothetical protein